MRSLVRFFGDVSFSIGFPLSAHTTVSIIVLKSGKRVSHQIFSNRFNQTLGCQFELKVGYHCVLCSTYLNNISMT